jgi:amino acid adenylation domain-containing protein
LEGLIGFFVNTLVLRTNLSGDPSFRELLGRVQHVVSGAYAHQELPFEKLVEELHPERSMSRNPLFQVMFVLANAPSLGLELYGTNVSRVEADTGTAKFDLTLSVLDQGQGLAAWIEYNTDLYDRATIERLLGHFLTLLAGIVDDPEQRISQLPLLTDAEQHQLLAGWNAIRRDCRRSRCIHELFEEQVTRTPEAIAVVYGNQQLTYHQLNARANRLAHYLRKLGVGPEVTVGICLENSLEMVVGLFGILKAGGAYVPLDPSYPTERLAYLLTDSGVSVVLTLEKWRRELASVLPLPREDYDEPSQFHDRQFASSNPVAICLDRDWEFAAEESDENPFSNVTAENLAYIIYTSGSTGQPKGVAIEHRSLANYLGWVNEILLSENVRVMPMVSKLSFDASLKQVFAPLLRGNEVWIIESDAVAQPAVLLQLLAQRCRVGLNCVPSLWKSILDASELGQGVLPSNSLTSLFVGGEELTKELVDRTRVVLPDLQIWNLYGPTEITANATAARLVPEEDVSIGRPLSNVQTYLLDRHLNLVPIGISGQLHCGGACVARGYHNRPDLTAERFIPNSFGDVPGSRLYRTGDWVRYRTDGNIEFLGRIDHQLKIRGFRIEPGEIEAALRTNAAVEQVVVLARQDGPEDQQLVAYIVPRRRQSLQVSKLRAHLKQMLPEYMVPSAFVVLDKLPLTSNGKVDHRVLPAPNWSRREAEASYVAPRTQVEKSLVGIWAEVLKKEPVGIRDNFFDLGGHSLMATQVMSRVRRTFQLDIPLRVLFETPSIEDLAIAIGMASAENPSA